MATPTATAGGGLEGESSSKAPSAGDSFTKIVSHSNSQDQGDDDEDEVVEQDPTGRYSRYKHLVGKGRFKSVYKGFDEKQGIDIAWSKIEASNNHLSQEQMKKIVEEISYGLGLDHPHVIRCYQCWEDTEQGCINMVTEYFTSGNLRDYRMRHKSLDIKAVKKWARQIMQGLAYLHNREPPVVHGDLRCDKIYINGHTGTISIGDLGLAVLVPKRFSPGVMPEGDLQNQYTRSVDIFAYGLLVLELVTKCRLDVNKNQNWQELVDTIQDDQAKNFIQRCLAPVEQRPSAQDLLDDPFLQPPRKSQESELRKIKSDAEQQVADEQPGQQEGDQAECEAGTVRGEDYCFEFNGKIRDGKLHFRLHMEYEGEGDGAGSSKTIDFVYDPEVDTPDEIAVEISNEFHLSNADRDICAAALKEWLAKEMGDSGR